MKYKLKTAVLQLNGIKKPKRGKVLRRKAFRGHILGKKSQKRKRNLRSKGIVFKGEITRNQIVCCQLYLKEEIIWFVLNAVT